MDWRFVNTDLLTLVAIVAVAAAAVWSLVAFKTPAVVRLATAFAGTLISLFLIFLLVALARNYDRRAWILNEVQRVFEVEMTEERRIALSGCIEGNGEEETVQHIETALFERDIDPDSLRIVGDSGLAWIISAEDRNGNAVALYVEPVEDEPANGCPLPIRFIHAQI